MSATTGPKKAKPAAKKPRAKAAPKSGAEKPKDEPRRPHYDPAVVEVILERLAQGDGLATICREPGMPPESSFRYWVVDDVNGLAARYARARDVGTDARAEAIPEKAREARGMDAAGVQAVRLEIDSIKWVAAKLAPKRYGDHLHVEGEITHHHYLHLEYDALLEKAQEKLKQLGLLKE
jgi:hypothetical protein